MKKVKYIFHGMDKPLLIITIILFLFGLLNIVTASSQATVVHLKNSVYDYFFNQTLYLLGGLALSLLILPSIFFIQNSLLDFISFLRIFQLYPCQNSLSQNIAILYLSKTISGFPSSLV